MKVTKNGIKSRLDAFQNIFHSAALNNDAADTIITAPSVADGIYTNISAIAPNATKMTLEVITADNCVAALAVCGIYIWNI